MIPVYLRDVLVGHINRQNFGCEFIRDANIQQDRPGGLWIGRPHKRTRRWHKINLKKESVAEANIRLQVPDFADVTTDLDNDGRTVTKIFYDCFNFKTATEFEYVFDLEEFIPL